MPSQIRSGLVGLCTRCSVGCHYNPAPLRRAGYVEQFDTLLAELSVREMLMYTAELKRPVQARSSFCNPSRPDPRGSGLAWQCPVADVLCKLTSCLIDRACLPLLQEPMAEKRAQVEHLLEVLGLQVAPRPLLYLSLLWPSSAADAVFLQAADPDCLYVQGCADTHIGDVLSRGISGGQAKRTNIGIALISKCDPAIVHAL